MDTVTASNARMEERLRALEQEATANIERAALFSIEVGRSIVLLSERVTQLEERLAVLEEDRATPGMMPAQYIALRSQWQ